MLTATDLIFGAVLPFAIALVVMLGTLPKRKPSVLPDADQRAFLLPMAVLFAVLPAGWLLFRAQNAQLWPMIDADDYLVLSIPLAALGAIVLDLLPRPRWVTLVGSAFVVALAVAPILYVKTTMVGPASWSYPVFALHVVWISLAGGSMAWALGALGRIERSPVLPIVLSGTALLLAAWMPFGAAMATAAPRVSVFAWAIGAGAVISMVRKSNAISTAFAALTVGGLSAFTAWAVLFGTKPDAMYLPILLGPLLLMLGFVPIIRNRSAWVRVPVLALLALLPGLIGTGLSARAYYDNMNKQSTDPYGYPE
ncbi:MAG: hypothetical protein QM770_23325 [Tepidisphaeraceae bacterium]